MLIDLYRYKNLVQELIKRDIKKKYRRSVLGILWSMLNPLLMMMITAMVFSNLFRFEIRNYVLYLLSGQLLFTFFSESTNFAMGSILENSGLLKKVYVPKYLFPLSRVLSSGVNLLFTLPAMIIVMIYTGERINSTLVYALVPLLLLLFFNFGIGLFLSASTVFFRDVFYLYGVFLTALSYATPIFYPVSIVPDKYIFINKINPLYYYLSLFRTVVYDNRIPDIFQMIPCVILSIVSLVIGIFVFKKSENMFVMYL